MLAGVLDVGTNSVRVLVTDGVRDIERDLIITRLGEGVDARRVLGELPMRRTVDAIASYVERCRAHGVERLRVIATSAVRDAANREDFLRAVHDATGVTPDVLSGEEEARLGFQGATASIDAPAPYLVCDIGGGSTELVLGTTKADRFISLDIGSVRLTERHVHSDPPPQVEIDALRADADRALDDGVRAIGSGAATLVGLAGTITTMAAIDLELDGYDRDAIHHHQMSREAVTAIRARMQTMTSEARRALPAMPRGREDVIVGGAVILEQVMARFQMSACLVSESDILDGTALDLIAR